MIGNVFDRRLGSIVARLKFMGKASFSGYIQEGTHGGLRPYFTPIDKMVDEMEAFGLTWVDTMDHNARRGIKFCNWFDPWPYHVFCKGQHEE